MLTIVALLCAFIMLMAVRQVNYRSNYGLSPAATKQLSWPAQEIVKAYRKLPVESRPYGDIAPIVTALDIKHGGKERINREFFDSYSEHHTWAEGGYSFPEYKDIYDATVEVTKALATQERVLQVSAVEGRLDEAQVLLERLREEREIIRSTTKQLEG